MRCASHTFKKDDLDGRWRYMKRSDCDKVLKLKGEKSTLMESVEHEKQRCVDLVKEKEVILSDKQHLAVPRIEIRLEV